MNKEYLNKYKEIATILNSNISNHIKQTKYFNKLDEQVNKLLYKRFCEHNTSVDTKFCKIDGTITNYININDLIYKIELDLPQYRNIFDKIFQKSNNNLDLGLILINANSLDSSNNSGWYNGLYNNVLMSIHNYIMTKLVPKYVILMRHFYRLSKNYNEIILDIKLDDYKSYAYKLNREYFEKNRQQSDYSIISKNNIIDEYVINNSNKELPLYKKLLQLFYKTNSIEAVTLLASKIEKDLIYIKLEKKFNLLKKNNTNFSKEQVVLINSIIKENIAVDINLFTETHKNKLKNYITSEDTEFDKVLELKNSLIPPPPKIGRQDDNSTNSKVINILIIIVLILLVLLLLISICYASIELYYYIKKCNNTNNNNANTNSNII